MKVEIIFFLILYIKTYVLKKRVKVKLRLLLAYNFRLGIYYPHRPANIRTAKCLHPLTCYEKNNASRYSFPAVL
jgi:hypothetical protein